MTEVVRESLIETAVTVVAAAAAALLLMPIMPPLLTFAAALVGRAISKALYALIDWRWPLDDE